MGGRKNFRWREVGGAFCKGITCTPARWGIVCSRLAASRSLIQGLVSTARRGGLPFAPAKGSKTGQRGTRLSPLQSPLALGCAGYGRCKHRPYPAQMRSKGSHRRICPLSPAPSPAIGGGDVYPNPCLPSLSSRQLLSALSSANLPSVASPQVIFPRRNAISFSV